MIDEKKFIALYCHDKPRWYNETVPLVLDRLKRHGDGDVESLWRDDFIYKLFLTKFGVSSESHYKRVCHVLSDIYEYLGINHGFIPSYQDVQTYWLHVNMFPSIESVLMFVDTVGDYWLGYEYNGKRDLVLIKVVAALAWYGLSIQEMSELQSRCTVVKDGACYLCTGDRQIQIDPQTLDALRLLPVIREYRSLPDGRWSRLESGYSLLFPRKSGEETSKACIHRIWLRWNRFVKNIPEEFSQNISYNAVKDSGICYRIYADTDDDLSLIEKVRKWSGMRDSHAYTFQIVYKNGWIVSMANPAIFLY